MNSLTHLQAFAETGSLEGKWTSARDLMSAKAKPAGEDSYLLLKKGFEDLGKIALEADDPSRLVAIDLLVRIPSSMKNNKRVQAIAREIRQQTLMSALPNWSAISEAKTLPGNAKPAEIRENVAVALADASGDWVVPYLYSAITLEDRSQRCRLALAKELSVREGKIDIWLRRLIDEPALGEDRDQETAANRLRDLCDALVEGVRANRSQLTVTPEAGVFLAKIVRIIVTLGSNQVRPKGLDRAACAAIDFLNEILAVRLTIMDEPDLYELIPVIHRWWAPRPYPDSVVLSLVPIVDKIAAGLVFRARGGQRSDALLQRLKQALNAEERYRIWISQQIESETGLSGEIQDWLRGIERVANKPTAASSLTAVAIESFVRQISEIYLLAEETSGEANNSRLLAAIRSVAGEHGLSLFGKEGDIVEYSPNIFEMPAGSSPKERSVRILRPPIIRRRRDGGSDIIIKGLATGI